ncbi:hypothetical protein, partial [Pseudomonas paraeruginosa]|uniref:hypothetical protein n=1 Tax=Pseudomonas paraeruginosa TaxID=2994495 RepID=UPI003A4C5E72
MSSNHANGGIRYFVNDTSRKALAAAGEALRERPWRTVSERYPRKSIASSPQRMPACCRQS